VRALAHPKLNMAAKKRLRELYRTLDPVALLAEMPGAKSELGTRVDARAGKISAAANPPAPASDTAAFAKGLGNDVHLGEQRVIHRRMRKAYKTRVRLPSMFDPHLVDIEWWLVAEPRLTVLAILGRARRALSRRVRAAITNDRAAAPEGAPQTSGSASDRRNDHGRH
jgi:hypothetical protein